MILATREKTGKFDWVLIALYLILVVFGWVNIYLNCIVNQMCYKD